jgi:hypothetical protein
MRTLIILLVTAAAALAATLTVDIPSNDVPRVSEAYGSIYNLGHNASMQEVSAATQKWIIEQTRDYERRKNMVQYSPPPMEMQPSPTPTATAAPSATAFKAAPTATPKKK